MVDFTNDFYESETKFKPFQPFSSYDSCTTDEGYCTDDKPNHEETTSSNDIPILKSNRIIQITYSPITYTLTLCIILFSFYTLIRQPFPWGHTFPPLFELFHLSFHITHLLSHHYNWLTLERLCIVYGTWLYWTGWLLYRLLFSERLTIETNQWPTLIFWLLMIERRNGWGIIVWEFISQLDQNLKNDSAIQLWELGSFRLLMFRIWCLLGTGSFWGLTYTALAKLDGYAFKYLLQFHHLMKLLLVSTLGGCSMIIFWSFWTFQYKGVLWQDRSRKGIIVWYSDGVAHAAKIV